MQIYFSYKYKENDPVRCKFNLFTNIKRTIQCDANLSAENIELAGETSRWGKIWPGGAEFSNLQYGKYGKGRITGLLLLTHQNCGD